MLCQAVVLRRTKPPSWQVLHLFIWHHCFKWFLSDMGVGGRVRVGGWAETKAVLVAGAQFDQLYLVGPHLISPCEPCCHNVSVKVVPVN